MIKAVQPESTNQWIDWERPESVRRAKNWPNTPQAPCHADDQCNHPAEPKDGASTTVRVLTESDAEEIQKFYEKMFTQLENDRMHSKVGINSALTTSLSEIFDPDQEMSMVAIREVDDKKEVIGVGCYMRSGSDIAEVSITINDEFQGQGIEDRLLARLSLVAQKIGIDRFTATVHETHVSELRAFRQRGFKMIEKANDKCIIVEKLLCF